jgi:pterin-4a-carbinolamine dehydratase
MRTVEIMGGLGNQLFQIFALLAYCLRYKKPFYFSAQAITSGVRKKTYWDTLLLQNLAPFVKSPQPLLVQYREPDFHYQAIPDCPQQTLILNGYFQSYKYFADQEEKIYRFLQLRKTQATLKNTYTPQQPYEKTLAIHFRIGDYASLPNHHPLMTLEYYKAALTQFLQDTQTASDRASALCETLAQTQQAPPPEKWHILYFCEAADQAYVETQLLSPLKAEPLFQNRFTYECIQHQLNDWEQVVVMSLCRHHIIANSTFSWWGAYLGDNSPRVYYPTTWFGPALGPKNTNDLFPPHWQRIKI